MRILETLNFTQHFGQGRDPGSSRSIPTRDLRTMNPHYLLLILLLAGCGPKEKVTRVAVALPLTGDIAALGQGLKRACVLALEERGLDPAAGEILVTGATGGVGSVAVAVLAERGYEVVASTGRTAERPYLGDDMTATLRVYIVRRCSHVSLLELFSHSTRSRSRPSVVSRA